MNYKENMTIIDGATHITKGSKNIQGNVVTNPIGGISCEK